MDLKTERLHVRSIEFSSDREICINQWDVGDVGCVVWDAALVLFHYLDRMHCQNNLQLSGKRVIELGSGTGVVGLAAAACGANCIITDLSEFVPLMQSNIVRNEDVINTAGGHIEALELKWGSDCSSLLPYPDFLLLADCIYYDESLEPLSRTIQDLTGPQTVVFCSYERRTTGNKLQLEKSFFEILARTFDAEHVSIEEMHPVFRSEDIHIVKLTRKSANDIS